MDENLKDFASTLDADKWFAEHLNGEWENGSDGIVLHVDAPDYVVQAVKEFNEELKFIRMMDKVEKKLVD